MASSYQWQSGVGCTYSMNLTVDLVGGFLYGKGLTLFCVLVLPLVFVVGLISNMAFIVVVIRVPRMRNRTNCYLINLAITDIIFLLSIVGTDILAYILSPIAGDTSYLGWQGYMYLMVIVHTVYFASLFFITLVTIDRFYALCRPLKLRHVNQTRQTAVLTTTSWLMSFLIASMLFVPGCTSRYILCITWPDVERFSNFPSHVLSSYVSTYFLGFKVVPYAVTLVLNLTLYVKIVSGVRASGARLRVHSDTRDKDKAQVIRLVIVNGVAFFLLLAPFEINATVLVIKTLLGDYSYATFHKVVSFFALTLTYINSVVNPLIFAFISKSYRVAFKEAFGVSQWRQKRNMSTSTLSSYKQNTSETVIAPNTS
ncbi:somatostatin receptor type 5-like [Diadema antillarum]|uniref:somatostatin receptor type 5-like n=1 Tax=Diadema antillarum TaxID=105358 RepID=UPI003A89043B